MLSLVMPSPTTPLSVENEATVGSTGAAVSMVTLSAPEAALMLPAASAGLAVRLWLPSASAAVAKVQAPLPLAVAARAGWRRHRPSPWPGFRRAGQGQGIVVGDAVADHAAVGRERGDGRGTRSHVSMVTLSALEAALILPAASLAVAVRLWVPSVSAAVAKRPGAAAIGGRRADQGGAVIDLHRGLGAAVPVSVSVLSLVMPSPTTPLSVENEAMVGAPGATVSMVTLSAVEAALILPAASIAFAVRLAAVGQRRGGEAPGAAAVGGRGAEQGGAVIDLHRGMAAAVPVSVSVLSLVMPSPTTPLSVENEAIVGAPGAAVSMVTFSALEAAPVLPAASIALAVRLGCRRSERRGGKAPGAAAVGGRGAEQGGAVIDLHRGLASAVPVSVRVLSLVMPSPTTPLSVENEAMAGATGATVSMVTLSASEAALVLPAASVAVAVRLWAPLVSAAVV